MSELFGRPASKTLRTEVMKLLRNAIISGKLKPGDHLKENEVADQMGVSRSPVREAFRQLEQEGLISSIPNQGCFVKTFDAKEIEEIFTLRAALESLACELIIRDNRLQPSDWKHLDNFIVRQNEAIEGQAFDRLTKLDMDFHEFICMKSGSERLVKMWRSLRGQIQVLFYQRFRMLAQVPETVDSDHEDLLDAIREGNIELVTNLNKEINSRVAQDCIEVFLSISSEPEI